MTQQSSGEKTRANVSPGTPIAGRYVVTSHLGSGGMGDVFEVEHTLLGKRFALKRLAGEGAADRSVVERFLREARAAAATGHPGVVDVVDLGFDDDGQPYLVMERLVGETLRRRLERGPLDETMLVRLGRAVLGALAAVHGAGIVHRDIKPENLFLCRDGRVKVLDFGLSHTTTVDVRLTQSGAVMGTPLYMSPEQARGEDTDARSDLYAVGAVLYECAAGRPPFTAPGYSVLIAMILEVKPNEARLAHLSPGVRELILSALAKNPAERPKDAATMRAGLGEAEEGEDEATWGIGDGGAESGASTDVVSAPTMAAPSAEHAAMVSAPTVATLPGPTKAAKDPEPATVKDVAKPASKPAPVPVARTRRRWPLVAAVVALLAVGAVVMILMMGKGKGGATETSWQAPLLAGDLPGAVRAAKQAEAKHPDDLELAGRDLLLALVDDRTRAYARVKELENKQLPVFAASAVAAVKAVEHGQPDVAADALAAAAASVVPGSADDLLVRYARGHLLRNSDRFDLARGELSAILDRWPAFFPAIDALLEPLLFLDQIDEAEKRVDAFVAAAPASPSVDKLQIELLIGERKYREALDRIEQMIASSPGRVDEIYQFRGDLRVLLGDPAGAITAYDAIDDRWKHDQYTSGALGTEGHFAEAKQLLVAAIHDYPKDIKESRLGKLMLDCTLAALETKDQDLASECAHGLDGRDPRDLEAPVVASGEFSRAAVKVLAGDKPSPSDFTLGEESPFWAYFSNDLPTLRAATEHMHFGLVPSYIYVALWRERARLESAAGDGNAALDSLERVVRPRHYDDSRGMVIDGALALKADILDKLGRSGEASAVRRELAQLTGVTPPP